MITKQDKVRALKEAVIDTVLAGSINIPMNYVIVWVCLEILGFGAIATSTTLIIIFTIFAVTRKYHIRLYFERNQRKKQQEQTAKA